jgi:RNase H-fold protein (predicted Holliday junction resolvase)
MLATLSAEQIPVAEQLLRGGIAAVRTAIAEQNKTLQSQSRPTIDPTLIERMAEDLVGRTALAFWKDRAAGAIGAGKELKLRDLRAVVTSAKTISHDDESRAMLKDLQSSLNDRIEHMRKVWNEKLSTALAGNNLKETLTLIARPPDVSTRVSAEDAAKIVGAVSEALNASQEPSVWNELVTLTVETSIRRQVKPSGIPANETSKAVAIKNAGAIPELAKLLGMAVPPPPPPSRTARPRKAPSRA